MIGQDKLKKILPHAYPFLLIDRVTEFEKDKYLTAEKAVTANEWALNGPVGQGPLLHFPETLLIEAAAQAALVLYHLSRVKEGERVRYYLGRVEFEQAKAISIIGLLGITAVASKMFDLSGYIQVYFLVEKQETAKAKVFYTTSRDGERFE